MNRFTGTSAQSATFVTHYFGQGLAEGQGRYAVERFRTRADGRIRRAEPVSAHPHARRTAGPVTASLRTVKAMRPARNEIVVCTALNERDSGVAYYGDLASGLFRGRRPGR
ncbi:MAG: hypothetical protein OXB97_13255 [Rhodospirillales bacterium]|nr:hypothetical protein [Rhodospirillales bacterium]